MYNSKRIIRDVPFMLWIMGVFTIAIGIYGFLRPFIPLWVRLLLIVIGLLMGLLPSILNVYADRGRRILVIERASLIRRKQIEVPFENIQRIFVDRRVSKDSDGYRSDVYQVILVLGNGERVPLRESYSGARKKHERFADIIASEVGVDQVDHAPDSIGEALAMAMQLTPADEQESITGIAPGEHESNGVRWQLETFNLGGTAESSTVHRWSSMNVDTPNDFVFIVQKMEGMGEQRGLMKLAGKFLFKTSLQMYGFDESFAPGLEKAETVEDVDERLVDKFLIYTSDPELSRQLLNPWMVRPLLSWSERYELSPGEKEMHQLAVLFSPYGLYVSQLGQLDRAEVDELVALGVELVKAK